MPAILRRGAFCLFALALASLQAEERIFGPKDLVSELLQRNPEIQAARSRFEAATKRPSQVGTMPEPRARYTNFGVGHPFSSLNATEFVSLGPKSQCAGRQERTCTTVRCIRPTTPTNLETARSVA